MSDVIAKLVMIPVLDPKMWKWWRDEVWRCELDAQMCCGGYMCGCRGSTWREMYSHYNQLFRLVSR